MRKTCVGNQSQAWGVWEMKSEWTGQYSGDSSLWWWLEGATEAEFVTKPLPCERLLMWRGKWCRGLPRGLWAGLSGWKSVVREGSRISSALTQDRSSGLYPSQSTIYWIILPRRRESRSSRTRYASSLSMMMGGALWSPASSRSSTPLRPPAGLSKETWKVGEMR